MQGREAAPRSGGGSAQGRGAPGSGAEELPADDLSDDGLLQGLLHALEARLLAALQLFLASLTLLRLLESDVPHDRAIEETIKARVHFWLYHAVRLRDDERDASPEQLDDRIMAIAARRLLDREPILSRDAMDEPIPRVPPPL